MKEFMMTFGIEKADVTMITNILNLLMDNIVWILLVVFAVYMVALVVSFFKVKYAGTSEPRYMRSDSKNYYWVSNRMYK